MRAERAGSNKATKLAYASTAHKGAAGELVAAQQLMAQGFEVFRNVSPCGPADLIAWSPYTGAVRKFDVKTGKGVLSETQRRYGVERFKLPRDGIHAVEGTENLKLRRRGWYARLDVPEHLIARLNGRTEYVRSLKTRELAEANQRKGAILAAMRAEMYAAAGET